MGYNKLNYGRHHIFAIRFELPGALLSPFLVDALSLTQCGCTDGAVVNPDVRDGGLQRPAWKNCPVFG